MRSNIHATASRQAADLRQRADRAWHGCASVRQAFPSAEAFAEHCLAAAGAVNGSSSATRAVTSHRARAERAWHACASVRRVFATPADFAAYVERVPRAAGFNAAA